MFVLIIFVKTAAYRIINQYRERRLDRPRSGRFKKEKITQRKERYIRITSRRRNYIQQSYFAERPRTVSGTKVSAVISQNRLRCTWRMIKPSTFCPFQKCLFLADTLLHTNEIKLRCMQNLVLNNSVIVFTAKHLIQFVYISPLISVINVCSICHLLPNFFFSILDVPYRTGDCELSWAPPTRAPRGTDRSPEYKEHFCF